MNIKTSQKILGYIQERGKITAKEIGDYLEISPRAIFKQLHNLLEKGKVWKIGRPPKVFYSIPGAKEENNKYKIPPNIKKVIEENFLMITPTGEKKEGIKGFIYWCGKRKMDIEKTAADYQKTINKFKRFKNGGLINGKTKIKSTFKKNYLDQIYYIDFYSIERFGKTKLGQLLLYAKQSQNKPMIKIIANTVKPRIKQLIKKFKIDAIAFIPPTVKREIQFMKELERNLITNLPKISIVKVKTDIMVPQKSLNKLEDRIENAKETIIVDEKNTYDKILIIDDAIGSGATLNETAAQIKNKKIAKKVIGLAITGSFKGFDIISEV